MTKWRDLPDFPSIPLTFPYKSPSFISKPSLSPPIFPMERKQKKPLMEKFRRTRMNSSMNELKERIVKAFPNGSSKLEKADILEKSVQYVQFLEDQIQTQTEQLFRERFGAFHDGYRSALGELNECLKRSNLSADVRSQVSHLIADQIKRRFPNEPKNSRQFPMAVPSCPPFVFPLPIVPISQQFQQQIPQPSVSADESVHLDEDEDDVDVEGFVENKNSDDSGLDTASPPSSKSELWRPFAVS